MTTVVVNVKFPQHNHTTRIIRFYRKNNLGATRPYPLPYLTFPAFYNKNYVYVYGRNYGDAGKPGTLRNGTGSS